MWSNGVHPDLVKRIVERVLPAMAAFGTPMHVVQGVRTADQQHHRWLQGREGNPGPIVTNCDGYKVRSNHQANPVDGLGHAVDCAFVTDPWGEHQPWEVYGALGEACGLAWGGRWSHPNDRPHLELRPNR